MSVILGNGKGLSSSLFMNDLKPHVGNKLECCCTKLNTLRAFVVDKVWIPSQTSNDPMTGSHNITFRFPNRHKKENKNFYLLHAPSLNSTDSNNSTWAQLLVRALFVVERFPV